MEILGNLNDREIIYVRHSLERPWYKAFPNQSWLLFVIADKFESTIFREINRRALDNNVVYVCSTGREGEKFHTIINEDIVVRDADIWQYLPKHIIMTTWNEDMVEGLWFTMWAAQSPDEEINTIICLDLSLADQRIALKELVKKLSNKLI